MNGRHQWLLWAESSRVEGRRRERVSSKQAKLDAPSFYGKLDTETTKEKRHKSLILMAF